jgi:endoglucanase
VQLADFSKFDKPGKYILTIDGLGTSVPFEIGDKVFTDLAKGTLKAFYLNRSGIELTPEFAGKYARPLGHPDTAIIVLPSAASASRPAGTIISTPKGWYDAGDYNKYIVNSGISTFSLLSAYESYPAFYDTLTWNIPESKNNIPDILDEALWNIEWEMTMQDPKMAVFITQNHRSFVCWVRIAIHIQQSPLRCWERYRRRARFRCHHGYDGPYLQKYNPQLAADALAKAEKAWQWAKANPKVPFRNPQEQDGYPAIHTGGYGDWAFHR